MDNFVRISDSAGLVRDLSTGAIINTNTSEYENYLKQVKARQEEQLKLQQHDVDIKEIKSELSEIKQLLVSLVNKDK